MRVYFSFVNVTRVYGQVTTRCHYLKGATTPTKGKQLASLRCHISHPMLNSQDKVLYIIVSTVNLFKGKKITSKMSKAQIHYLYYLYNRKNSEKCYRICSFIAQSL